jgi:hypothetical protein
MGGDKSLAESLAGRAVFIELEGFCLIELSGQKKSSGWLASWLENPEGYVRRDHNLQAVHYRFLQPLAFQVWLELACVCRPKLLTLLTNGFISPRDFMFS